jgi:phenylalanyl-tRNA synthetase beta chain
MQGWWLWSVASGEVLDRAWGRSPEQFNAFWIKGVLENLLELLRIEPARFVSGGPSFFHPFRTARIAVGDSDVGHVGQIHPDVTSASGVKSAVFAFEIDLGALLTHVRPSPTIRPPLRVPSSRRDLALVVPDGVSQDQLQLVISEHGGPLLKEILCFDMFSGGNVPKGKRSIAFALTFRADDRTLATDEIQTAQDRIVAALEARLGASLRA